MRQLYLIETKHPTGTLHLRQDSKADLIDAFTRKNLTGRLPAVAGADALGGCVFFFSHYTI